MTELRNTCKKPPLKKNDLSSRSLSSFLCTPANASRLSLPGSKLVRKACISLEPENISYEEYTLEYSKYLLRKAQNKLLAQSKSSKEQNVKKCFVSLKLEFEELINKNLKLRKELICFKSYLDIIKDTSKKVEDGKKLLEGMRESNFEILLKALSDSLDNVINQLQLVDIDKKLIQEMFEKNVWGSGCELEECLKKIDTCISKNKEQVSDIAGELKELKRLWVQNLIFREKFASLFKTISDDILESNYSSCVNVVKKAFTRRQDKTGSLDLEFDMPELDQIIKGQHLQHTLELSKFESFVIPKGSSTPQPENK